jgi:hypothetical protein
MDTGTPNRLALRLQQAQIAAKPVQVKLKYLWPDRDRHGNTRYYVCPPGAKKTRLRAEPGSAEFLAQYNAAIEAARGGPPGATAGGARNPGSLGWLVGEYRKGAEWQQLGASTRYARGGLLERALANIHKPGAPPDGHLPYRLLEPRHIRARRDTMADRPEAANGYVKTLRQ